jgi:hypothetical protein
MPNIATPLLSIIAACVLAAVAGGPSAAASPCGRDAAIAQAEAVERFQALAEQRARDYDRTRDIGPEQLLALLDVAERTGYSLGQLLATGEHESAHTWNNFVRPPLGGDRVGAAAGVWQFQPATFARVIHLYGEELLALADADSAAGRRRLDLGFGPFSDDHVRLVIRDTVDGLRGPDDPELGLLRHDFTVLAIAKYLLSRDSGAANPVEDYLFHFLGPEQGRRILTLARGDDRDTRAVKPPPAPGQATAGRSADRRGDGLPPRPKVLLDLAPRGYILPPPGARHQVGRPASVVLQPRAATVRLRPAIASGLAQATPPHGAAPHGYEHDSPVVSGNLGMFYRDGPGRTDPYTWAEFLEHLASRVRADQQPELVRAKYGVGFPVNGGDMPARVFDPAQPGANLVLRLDDGRPLPVPKAQLTGPLDAAEMRDYQHRLAALIALGDAEPTALLSDAAARTLYRLGLLSSAGATEVATTRAATLDVLGTDMGPGRGFGLSTADAHVRDALHAFRELVGKAPPDDPVQTDLVLPAERIALELYGARIARVLAARQAEVGASADPKCEQSDR